MAEWHIHMAVARLVGDQIVIFVGKQNCLECIDRWLKLDAQRAGLKRELEAAHA